MDSFINAVELVEKSNLHLPPLAVVRGLRKTAGHEDQLTLHFLGASNNLSVSEFNTTFFSFFDKAIHHVVTDHGEERGVVLTQDGTTVALAPLLLGIEVGLKAKTEGTPPLGMIPLTLAKNLGLSFLHLMDFPASQRLGPDGCWDSVVLPRVFRLSRLPTLATDALINGGMDGAILGMELAHQPSAERSNKLSDILRDYYIDGVKGHGLEGVSTHISPKRRENSRALLGPLDPQRQVMETLAMVWKLERTEWIHKDTGVKKAVRDGVLEFVHRYWDCPPVIPRCQWGAEAHKATPIPLSLPLPFLYIHHTYEPSQPCLTFQQCSRDMRAMQLFHQDVRGWDDIGYSFVVGSNGYLYEGRGWLHRGRHTRDHSSIGYGVAFIGDYSSSVPSRHSLELVRHHLVKCAVDKGRLAANYTIHGHRQVVNTTCPGDALFSEIKSWENFREPSSM
ncbi:N-acetylmuramoyl-L-alanine amidase-like [Osmerus mordax]|uniref:N-acetylmuramoyl-L-alanine amidase-like n=1 Tax=Osmerus mordax TaxID=8014 RepID=UPI00350F0A7F